MRPSVVAMGGAILAATIAAGDGTGRDPAAREAFLRTARIVAARPAGRGVTASQRLTLSDGAVTRDAHFQSFHGERRLIDPADPASDTIHLDSWKHNIAADQVDRLLGLDMVPVSVERAIEGRTGALSWWVEDGAQSELDRLLARERPVDQAHHDAQLRTVRLFDALIANPDRNPSNLLVTRAGELRMIDHSLAFGRDRHVTAAVVTGAPGELVARIAVLDRAAVERALGRWLEKAQIDALMARQAAIIQLRAP